MTCHTSGNTYAALWVGIDGFQSTTVEAIIRTRLAFRPPERISSFNTERLNRFIVWKRNKIRCSRVEEFIKKFQLEAKVDENLAFLGRRRIKIKDTGKLKFLSQE